MNSKSYISYSLSFKEYLLYGIVYYSVCALFSYVFYDSVWPIILCTLFLKKFYTRVSGYLNRKRADIILNEFSDFIYAISSSLDVGYSFENAVLESKTIIQNIHGPDSIIAYEIDIIIRKLNLSESVESIFCNFSDRTNIDEIKTFCSLLELSKRTSGDINRIIRECSNSIRQKTELNNEVSAAIAKGKFEQLIMLTLPIIIYFFINMTNPGFFTPLYHNAFGILISTFLITMYLIAVWLSKKILDIEV